MIARVSFTIALLSILMISMQSCAPEDEYSISGRIQFDDGNAAASAAIYLFEVSPPDAYQSLVYNGESYPYVGAAAPHNWYFDHREHNSRSQKTVIGSASFEFNKVPKNDYYRVVAASEEYGWIYSGIFRLQEDEDIGSLVMYPETVLPSVLDENLTLLSGHHYVIENTVNVNQDVTLAIEAGAWLRFTSSISKLNVLGNLQALGSESDYIRFTYYDNSSPVSNWSRISFANDLDNSSTLNYCVIDHASTGLSVSSGSISIDNTAVKDCGTGISISTVDFSDISNSSILNCSDGINCITLMNIDRCFISNSSSTGISLSDLSAYISNSVIVNCAIGISEDYSDIFEVDHCIIAGNETGMNFEAGNLTRMFVHYCDLHNNSERSIFCKLDAYPDLSNNNFFENEYNVFLAGQAYGNELYHQSGDISAPNCYWGANSIDEIMSTFVDGNSIGADPRLGIVQIIPFELTARTDTGPE